MGSCPRLRGGRLCAGMTEVGDVGPQIHPPNLGTGGVMDCLRSRDGAPCRRWIPACAGMTEVGDLGSYGPVDSRSSYPVSWGDTPPVRFGGGAQGCLAAALAFSRGVPEFVPRALASAFADSPSSAISSPSISVGCTAPIRCSRTVGGREFYSHLRRKSTTSARMAAVSKWPMS